MPHTTGPPQSPTTNNPPDGTLVVTPGCGPSLCPIGGTLPTIHHGDCIETMNAMPPESIDAIVTDPPYGLGFMGRKWDALPPSQEWAEACYRVLKPGGHIAEVGRTKTGHRLAVAIEDAAFEMRDSHAWLYASGFPKSHDVGKAIDKLAGAEREVIGSKITGNAKQPTSRTGEFADGKHGGQQVVDITAPATPEAAQWDGWGTALKPGHEPVVLARKPLAEKTVARNVLAHGTGAINVDGCRIGTTVETWPKSRMYGGKSAVSFTSSAETISAQSTGSAPSGRWPANVLLDHHAAAWVDEQSGTLKTGAKKAHHQRHTVGGNGLTHGRMEGVTGPESEANEGGASRFFYTAKAPKRERPNVDGVQHPTVKPLKIMQWLIRLVTPPGGTVLDPFAGSGTTIEAALIEGFNPVGIEMETDYLPLIQHRIDRATPHPTHASETA